MYKTCFFLIKYVHKFNVFIFSCVFDVWYRNYLAFPTTSFLLRWLFYRFPTSAVIILIMPMSIEVKIKSGSVKGASTTSRLLSPECAVKLRFMLYEGDFFSNALPVFSLSLLLSFSITYPHPFSTTAAQWESLLRISKRKSSVCLCMCTHLQRRGTHTQVHTGVILSAFHTLATGKTALTCSTQMIFNKIAST